MPYEEITVGIPFMVERAEGWTPVRYKSEKRFIHLVNLLPINMDTG
jgi:hypothetical protein